MVSVPRTIAAMYVVAGLLGISFGILKTAVLKLAAVSIFTSALNLYADGAGYPLAGWLVAVAVTFYLFSTAFDLDDRETFLSVILISILRFILGLFLVSLLAS